MSEAQQAAPLTLALKQAELRAAEAQLDAEKAELRTKEAELYTKEDELRTKKDDLHTKEDDLRAAKRAKPGRYTSRAALNQAKTSAEQALAAAQAEVDAAKAAAQAAKEAARLAQGVVRRQQFIVDNLWNATIVPPILPSADIFMLKELPKYHRPEDREIQLTTNVPEIVQMPSSFQLWADFECGRQNFVKSLAGRCCLDPIEKTSSHIEFDHETMWGGAWAVPRETTIEVMHQLFSHLPLGVGKLFFQSNINGSKGGITDEVSLINGALYTIGERKAPLVFFRKQPQPRSPRSVQ